MSFSIIIPSRNATNLVACIRAIREAGETARIIVVDDGAWVEACEDHGFLMDKCLSCEPGEKPFVFARNVNIGIRAAGDDDVILLNDDALLKSPLGFTRMAEEGTRVIERPEFRYGLLAAACNTVGNPNQFQQRNRNQIIRTEPRMACFVCVYIPRSTINAVGLLDERFVDYGCDDDDYCLRVRNAGLKIGIFDGCFVDHSSLKSSFRGEAGAGGNFEPNLRRFIEKWGVDNWGNDREHSRYRHLFPHPGAENAVLL